MNISRLKLGLMALIVVQIITLFYLLHIYNSFVSNIDNYHKNYLVADRDRAEKSLVN